MNTPATSNSADYSGEQIAYKDSTYELVSKVAFLIGVPQRIFENEHEAPQLDVFNRLSKDKNARIIRNLCIIRTSIERILKKSMILCERITADFCPCRKIIPSECIQQLSGGRSLFHQKIQHQTLSSYY